MRHYKVPLTTLVRVKKMITCFKNQKQPSFRAPFEAHNFWEMVYVESGRMLAVSGDTETELKAGEIIFHAPNIKHTLYGNGKDAFGFFIVTFDCNSAAMPSLSGKKCKVGEDGIRLLSQIYEERRSAFENESACGPMKEKEDAPLGGPQMIQIYLEQFLILLLREEQKKETTAFFTSKSELESHLASETREYLESHLRDRVTMDSLCRQLHYGKSRLSSVFREHYGDSIMHYYLMKKFEAAARELTDENRDITEISQAYGFESPAYFSRMFRRYMGVCPREYRQSLMKKEKNIQ